MFFFKNYKTIIIVALIVLVALLTLSYNAKQERGAGFLRKTILEAAAPVQGALNSAVKSVSNAWQRYIRLVGLEKENRILQSRVNELQAELILYQESFLEAERLKNLLSLQKELNYTFVAARVIGREQAGLAKTILINKGSAHGLREGMPVIAHPGVVGRLIQVTWHASKVMLLIDESSNVDAIVQRTRTQGIIRGAGSGGCVLKYISKMHDVKNGDAIVTSGIGGIFPKGLLIGVVSNVARQEAGLFLKINIAPAIDFSRLEEVSVIVAAGDEKG